MAKQVNYPYTINTLSAKGSAEVIARGITNDYITQWSYNTNTIDSWDNVENFPTVVRTGNFVWCWYREYSNKAIYMLIDVVPDPEVEYQLGNNIAYPALLNGSVGEITPAVTSASVQASATLVAAARDVTDGPYYNLALDISANADPLLVLPYIHSTSVANGYKSGFISSSKSYKEIVADKWGDTPNVWGGFATSNSNSIPLLVGWGNNQYLLTTTDGPPSRNDGDPIYGIFAPFATYEQFQTLYGAESDWIHSTVGTNKTLFATAYDASNGAGIQYTNTADIENEYPFTVEAMQPQTKYRNIPGDTTGDGFDDTPSLEDALAVYGAVAGAFPGLDITKCGNLADLGLKIGDIDIPSINELKNSVKAAVDSAVDSIGLSKIDEMVQGFKDGLNDMLPDTTPIENLAKDISDLKDKGEDAYQKLVEKWDGLVDDIEGVIDNVRNLGGFDICEFVTDKAKTDDDGKLVKKEKAPSPPDRPIVPAERGFIRPQPQDGLPQDEVQQATGASAASAQAARTIYNHYWKLVLENFNPLTEQNYFMSGYGGFEGTEQFGSHADFFPDSFSGMGAFTSNVAADPDFGLQPDSALGYYKAKWKSPGGYTIGPKPIRDFRENIPKTAEVYLKTPIVESTKVSFDKVVFDAAGNTIKGPEVIDTFAPTGLTRGAEIVDPTGGNRTRDQQLNIGSVPTPQYKTLNYSDKAAIVDRQRRLIHRPDYQTVKSAGRILDPATEILKEEKETFKDYYRITYFEELVASAREQLENKFFKTTDLQITSDTKSKQLWNHREYLKKGSLYPGAIVSTVDQDDEGFFQNLIEKLHGLIDEIILVEPLLIHVRVISAGEISSDRIRGASSDENSVSLKGSTNTELRFKGAGATLLPALDADGNTILEEVPTPSIDNPTPSIDNLGFTDAEKEVGVTEEEVGAVKGDLGPMGEEGDAFHDVSLPQRRTEYRNLSAGSVTEKLGGAIRNAPLRPKLMNILQKTAEEGEFKIVIFSAGNPMTGAEAKAAGGVYYPKGRIWKVNDKPVRVGGSRHDKGYAADIEIYDKNGTQLLTKNVTESVNAYGQASGKITDDGKELIRCIEMLMKNGITSVGAHHNYMLPGNIHVDIATDKGNSAAIWGASHESYDAPSWLSDIFFANKNNKKISAKLEKQEAEGFPPPKPAAFKPGYQPHEGCYRETENGPPLNVHGTKMPESWNGYTVTSKTGVKSIIWRGSQKDAELMMTYIDNT